MPRTSVAPAPNVDDEPSATIFTGRWFASLRATFASGWSNLALPTSTVQTGVRAAAGPGMDAAGGEDSATGPTGSACAAPTVKRVIAAANAIDERR